MKLISRLLVVLVLCMSLPACTEAYPISTIKTSSGEAPTPITLGSTIDTEYVNMTLDSFEFLHRYGNEPVESIIDKADIYYSPRDMYLMCLKGKFTNKTDTYFIPATNPINGEIIINNNPVDSSYPPTYPQRIYKTNMVCYNAETGEPILSIAPSSTVDYCLYAKEMSNIYVKNFTLIFGYAINDETDLSEFKIVLDLEDNDELYILEGDRS